MRIWNPSLQNCYRYVTSNLVYNNYRYRLPYEEFAIIDLYQNWQVGFLLLFLLEFFFFITITKKFNGFFSFNFPLMDPDPWGKLNADPDPQLCFNF